MIFRDPQIDKIVSAIAEQSQAGVLFVIMVAENTNLDIAALNNKLAKTGSNYIGGVFPRLIFDESLLEKGVIVTKINGLEKIHVVDGLSSGDYKIEKHPSALGKDHCIFTLVDGLTSGISTFLSELYRSYGSEIRYLGGGAGSLTLEQAPCLFTHEGFVQDAAVYCLLKSSTHLGVKHGWQKLGGPFIATKTNNNIIEEINWRPAFEVYKEVVEADSLIPFKGNTFFDIAKGYPFGMLREGSECIVRDPIAVDDNNHLICVGEVPENSFIDILKGEKTALIEAAKQAALEAANQATTPAVAMVIDCISRVLFLDDSFNQEVKAISEALDALEIDVTLRGALTLGEISSFGEGFLEFFNKTTVVGLIE